MTTETLHTIEVVGEIPEQFTYPFQYTPQPIAIQACSELKSYLRKKIEWSEEIALGKMFGVLIVKDENENIYSLWAFSGLLDGQNNHPGFVPPVFDLQKNDEYFQQEDAEISKMPDGEEKSNRSRALQMWLFRQFRFLNAKGEEKDLCDIFDKETCRIPPSGAGECCAPKLLQFAYKNNLKPVCMSEFWLGISPKGEIRYENEYYPACQAKCKPILRHMLIGLDVEENPLLPMMRETAKKMRVIYDDDYILAVYKPAGMLAVKGNVDAPSVESIIQEKYPEISGPLIVHRLDMDTSGVMIIAKNKDIHKAIQIQFYKHEVSKKYIAILEGNVKEDNGIINLPLSPNRLDRPRQMVNYEHGKEAITEFEVIERNAKLKMQNAESGSKSLDSQKQLTRVAFYPQTGRTHQLRVHSAHKDGLGCPILGDRLYSANNSAERMYLHAETIDFVHPVTGKAIHLEIKADF